MKQIEIKGAERETIWQHDQQMPPGTSQIDEVQQFGSIYG